ncbi:RsmE family RNA methyltransferase [Lacticaseibacillus jixiensis]|uniref:RsmE family RNA methyltransferase n=1 Tax=Lacticaseibacillus jixiensis TaxID=3231926 RepID=UPI0036F392DE
MNRFFTSQALAAEQTVALEASIHQHAIKVLRMQPGAKLELVDAHQHAYVATIVKDTPLTVHVDAPLSQQVELPIAVHLVCGVGKGDKAEWIVQKATELGAAKIDFANMQWGTAKWPKERVAKKLTRLQAIAQGAAEQSHRLMIPQVGFTTLEQLKLEQGVAGVVAYEEAAKHGEASQLVQTVGRQPASLIAVFGPEGGLSPQEVTHLTQVGFAAAGLGPRIMRTETAPLYLLSAISALVELQEI